MPHFVFSTGFRLQFTPDSRLMNLGIEILLTDTRLSLSLPLSPLVSCPKGDVNFPISSGVANESGTTNALPRDLDGRCEGSWGASIYDVRKIFGPPLSAFGTDLQY